MLLACADTKEKPQETPWGTIVGSENGIETDENADNNKDRYNDIISQGELILATLSGPNTYYEYKGIALGTQYLLCLDYAKHIGVSLRVETYQREEELIERLKNNEADIIIFSDTTVSKELSKADSAELSKTKVSNWYVKTSNKELNNSISMWYTPDKLVAATSKEKDLTLQSQTITRRVYAPVMDKAHGVISQYDNLFRKYASTALVDWRLMAAQCYQESCFDPQARSWAGACGLMQIMPSTARTLSLPADKIFVPEDNIAAAARLLRRLNNDLSDIKDIRERICFQLAAYNCGIGHVRDAMALATKNKKNPHRWSDVAQQMMRLQKPEGYRDPVVRYGYMRATETVDYVERIRKRYQQYSGLAIGSGHVGGNASQSRIPSKATKKHKYKL